MREILFRAKAAKDGRWVFGYYSPAIIPIVGKIGCFINEGGYTAIEVDPETVGQFTGETDKNGAKIFEGDILKVKTMWHATFAEPENKNGIGYFSAPIKTETYWTVEHHTYETENGFMVFGIDRRWHRPLTRSRLYNADAEVVGNIYDNPELLKPESKNT